jgi:hypothetical protein
MLDRIEEAGDRRLPVLCRPCVGFCEHPRGRTLGGAFRPAPRDPGCRHDGGRVRDRLLHDDHGVKWRQHRQVFHTQRVLRTAGSCARNGTRCGKVGGWRVMAPVFPELTRRPPPGFFVSQAPSLALRIPQRGVAKTSSIIRDYASLSAPFHSSGSIRRRRSSMVIVPCSIRWFATATISGQNTRVNSSARR